MPEDPKGALQSFAQGGWQEGFGKPETRRGLGALTTALAVAALALQGRAMDPASEGGATTAGQRQTPIHPLRRRLEAESQSAGKRDGGNNSGHALRAQKERHTSISASSINSKRESRRHPHTQQQPNSNPTPPEEAMLEMFAWLKSRAVSRTPQRALQQPLDRP